MPKGSRYPAAVGAGEEKKKRKKKKWSDREIAR